MFLSFLYSEEENIDLEVVEDLLSEPPTAVSGSPPNNDNTLNKLSKIIDGPE